MNSGTSLGEPYRDGKMKRLLLILLTLCLLWASGCASQERPQNQPVASEQDNGLLEDEDLDFFEEEFEQEITVIADPLEPINRVMFSINNGLYFLVLKPIGRGYKAVVAEPIRICVKNFFNNLATPVRLANCLLQGKGQQAGTELQRFVINSTEGILGLGDPALEKHGIPSSDEDLGQTLAVWGIGDGIYLLVPLMGPTTLRDGVGRCGDMFLSPIYYVDPWEARYAVSGTSFINNYSFRLNDYDALMADAIDPYVAMRNMYIQYRKRQIEE